MSSDKRKLRQEKRETKKLGNRYVRHYLKRQLRDNPEESHWDEIDFGKLSTKDLNGKNERFTS